MVSDAMLAAYQQIIQKEFRTVRVSIENKFLDEYGVFINALGIPDDKRAYFARFVLDVLAPAIEAQGFDFIGVVPYSVNEAKAKFPDLWMTFMRERAVDAFREKILSNALSASWNEFQKQPDLQSDADLNPPPITATNLSCSQGQRQFSFFLLGKTQNYVSVETKTSVSDGNSSVYWTAA